MDNISGEPPEDQNKEEETTFNHPDKDDDLEWDDTTFDYPDDDVRENLDGMREADRNLGRGLGAKHKKITNIKKSILFELGYKLRKGDGKNSTELFDRLKLTKSEKSGDANGMKFDGVKIIILKKKKLYFRKTLNSDRK